MSDGRAAYGRSLARLSTRLAAPAVPARAGAMTKADQQREQRLAAALRDNLKRRKAQARDGEPDKDAPKAG